MKKILFVLSAAFCIAFYSCKTDKTKTSETKKERVIAKKTDAQVKTEMDNLLKAMDSSWNEMMASDDQKIANLQTLIIRIGRDKNFDKQLYLDVVAQKDNLKVKRYDRPAIANAAVVDTYDSVQISILDKTNLLMENSNLANRDTIAGQLYSKIQEDDSRVPMLRGYYDRAAKKYNQYLKDYQPQLQRLGAPYNALKPAPMFVEQPLL